MKKQYRVIDTDRVDWTIEIYHDGELIATEKFYDADEFDKRFEELKKAGYEQGYLPEEVQQIKEMYEKKLAKVIGSESKEKITDEYIKKEDVLKIIYDIKENKDIPKNYGTLIDIVQQVRNLPPDETIRLAEIKAVEDFAERLKKIYQNIPTLWGTVAIKHINNLVKERKGEE